MFITIPDTKNVPIMVQIEHITNLDMVDETISSIHLSDGSSFDTALQRDILVPMLMRKEERDEEIRKEPIAVTTQTTWAG